MWSVLFAWKTLWHQSLLRLTLYPPGYCFVDRVQSFNCQRWIMLDMTLYSWCDLPMNAWRCCALVPVSITRVESVGWCNVQNELGDTSKPVYSLKLWRWWLVVGLLIVLADLPCAESRQPLMFDTPWRLLPVPKCRSTSFLMFLRFFFLLQQRITRYNYHDLIMYWRRGSGGRKDCMFIYIQASKTRARPIISVLSKKNTVCSKPWMECTYTLCYYIQVRWLWDG